MNWKEWCEAYPCKKVDIEPVPWDEHAVYEKREDAETFKEWIEINYEMSGIEVLEFENKYYVCSAG